MNYVSNDLCFSRYLHALGRAGDCLLAITTSRKSPNVLQAAAMARSLGMHIVALSWRMNPKLESLSNIYLRTPAGPLPTACRNCTS